MATDVKEPVASALVSRPRLGRSSTGLLGRDDGWTDLEDDQRPRRGQPFGRPGQRRADRPDLGRDGARRRAARDAGPGLRADAARRRSARHGRAPRGGAPDRGALRPRLAPLPRRLKDGARQRRGRPAPVPRLGAGAGRCRGQAQPGARSWPRRRRRGSGATRSRTSPPRRAPTTWCGRATPTSSAPRCGPWATRRPPAASSTGSSTCSRSPTARSRRTPTSQGTPVWSELQLDEVALPIVLARLVGRDDARTSRGVKRAAQFLVRLPRRGDRAAGAVLAAGALGEPVRLLARTRSPPRSPAWSCAADIARKQRRRAPPPDVARLADRWQSKVKDWTGHDQRPAAASEPVLPAADQGRRPGHAARTYAIGDGGPSAVDQRRGRRPELPRPGPLRASTAPDDPAVLTTLSVVDDELRVRHARTGRSGTGSASTATARPATAGSGRSPTPDTGTTLGRGWPLLTGERGEYAVTAGRGRDALPRRHGGRRRHERHDLRAGLGRPPAHRRGLLPRGRGHPGRDAADVVARRAGAARLDDRSAARPVDQQAVVARRYVR